MNTKEFTEGIEKMIAKLKEPVLYKCGACGKMTDYIVLIGATYCCADCFLEHHKSTNG